MHVVLDPSADEYLACSKCVCVCVCVCGVCVCVCQREREKEREKERERDKENMSRVQGLTTRAPTDFDRQRACQGTNNKKNLKKNHRQRPCQGTHKKSRPSPRRRLQHQKKNEILHEVQGKERGTGEK